MCISTLCLQQIDRTHRAQFGELCKIRSVFKEKGELFSSSLSGGQGRAVDVG